MDYRKLGRTGLDVSAIGLGTEHLEQSKETMESVLRIAVEAGISYIDVLYGDTKRAADFWDNFAPAIKPYRDKLILAAHWGHPGSDLSECQRCFEDVLAYIGNDYSEVAIIPVVDSEEQWNEWCQEAMEYLLRYKEQGRIGHLGMSGHTMSTAIKAVNSGLIDVLMFPINLIGHDDDEIKTLYQACVDNDVGLVAMKPYHGGTLFSADGKSSGITPTQCLAYVLSLPVSTTVPGVKNAEELRATLHYLEATNEEKDYRSVIANIHRHLAGQCVLCNHCLPCPQNIDIGWIIWHVDQARGGITNQLMESYAHHQVKASECNECGVCMERCPFEVDIIAKMEKAVEIFETKVR